MLSVARDARPPLATPSFYAYEPGRDITFLTGTERRRARKAALLERSGALSLTAQRPEPPYKYVTVECRVVRADRPPSAEQVLAIARRYPPEELARGLADSELGDPASELVVFTARPERWLSADFGGDEA